MPKSTAPRKAVPLAKSITLAKWCERYNQQATAYGSQGAQHVFLLDDRDARSSDSRWELYHLKDWLVSSRVSGNAAVLVPRPKKNRR